MEQQKAFDFQRDVIERSATQPVLVDFWAPWCGPCRVLGPLLEQLADAAAGRWALVKIDVDAHPDLAQQFRIQGIPHVKLFVDGAPQAHFSGALPEPQLRAWLDEHVPSAADKILAQAQAAHAQGRSDEALDHLQPLLDESPAPVEARVLAAEITLAQDPTHARTLVADVEEGDPTFERAEAVRTLARLWLESEDVQATSGTESAWEPYLAGIQSLHDHAYDRALEHWIDAVRAGTAIDDRGPQRACLALFRWLGDDHALTQTYRREYASALY